METFLVLVTALGGIRRSLTLVCAAGITTGRLQLGLSLPLCSWLGRGPCRSHEPL